MLQLSSVLSVTAENVVKVQSKIHIFYSIV